MGRRKGKLLSRQHGSSFKLLSFPTTGELQQHLGKRGSHHLSFIVKVFLLLKVSFRTENVWFTKSYLFWSSLMPLKQAASSSRQWAGRGQLRGMPGGAELPGGSMERKHLVVGNHDLSHWKPWAGRHILMPVVTSFPRRSAVLIIDFP